MPPVRDEAGRPLRCARPPLPALFLAGDRNPLQNLVLGLKKSLEACRHELAFRLLPGADYDGERAALRDPKIVSAVLD